MKPNLLPCRCVAQTAAVCAAGACLLAAAGLALWWSDLWRQPMLGGNQVPMAPSTGLLMILLSAAAWLRSRPGSSRATRFAGNGCVLLVLAGAALIGVPPFTSFTAPVEAWLSRTSETLRDIPVGRMSPSTAWCFVLAALGLLLGCSDPARQRLFRTRTLAGCLGLGVLLWGGIFVAGYLTGTPLLYDGSTIPMAMLTGLAFVLVGAAMLLGAEHDDWPLRMFFRGSLEPAHGVPRQSQIEWPLLLLFLGLALGITLLGTHLLNRQQAHARSMAHAELEAIADLKVQQLVNWRNERLGDGRFFSRARFAGRDLARLLADPADAAVQSDLIEWLTLLKAGRRYDRVTIFDSRLNPLLSIPPLTDPPDSTLRAHLNDALDAGTVFLADLHRHERANEIHLDLFVPVATPEDRPTLPEPPTAGGSARPLAVLHLEIDPRRFLYPLVQTWPTPSPTAETLLVRREGPEILYLNELRHRSDTAMTLRRPLEEAIAVVDQNHIHAGVDYRGVRVVAAARAVPETDWFMVAKVDESELYAPLRRQALAGIALTLLLLLAATLAVTMLSRRRDERFLRSQLAAEHERRVLAERFEHLMKHAGDTVLLTDPDGRILEANDCAIQTYGWSLGELQRLTLIDLRAPETRAQFPHQNAPLREGRPVRFETVHRRKDGSTLPVEVSANLVEVGGVPLTLGIVRDISQRKLAEERLRKLSRAVEQSPVSVVITNAAGEIEYVNPRFTQTTGYSLEEVRGRNPRLLKGNETPPEVYRGLWQTITRGGVWQGEFHNRRKDGGRFWEHASISPILDEAGRITHFLGIKEDITERKQLQHDLALRKRELDSFFTGATTGMAMFDPQLRCVRVNQMLAQMNDLPVEAHLGRSVKEIAPRLAAAIEPILRQVLATGEPVLDIDIASERNGEPGVSRFWLMSFFPIPGMAGKPEGVGAVVVDITERKRLERERAAMESQLRQQQRLESIGTLAGGVAHEINNPINGIVNYAQLIQDRLGPRDPLVEYTAEIIHETQRVTTIVRNLLTFSRTDKQSHSPARMVDIVDATLSLIRTVIRHDQISFTVEVPPDLPPLNCRSQQIQQVLMNLMTNSRDALNERYPGHDPGKVLRLEARRVQRDCRHWIRVTVEDHGTGILPEVRERMFDPFFTTKPRDQGTGLGLSISHGIVKEHHGHLTVESEPGRFTRIHLDLPVEPGPNN